MPPPFFSVEVADESETRRLANDIAVILKAGDTVCLSGDLGAGKSAFSRAVIRNLAGDPELEVPSPTFTLVQTYALDRFELSHFDLYRLEEPEELDELGLDDLLETGAALIEWPEKAGGLLPPSALWIRIGELPEDPARRVFSFSCDAGDWRQRIDETLGIRAFLCSAGRSGAERRFLAGDASLRTFETVNGGGAPEDPPAVLMRWPFKDGTVSEGVRTYMHKVHLAEDCRSVVAVGGELRRHGFLAPEILASDLEQGLVLSRDLGRETIVADGRPVPDRYHAAVAVLAAMHEQAWPERVQLADGSAYALPAYSREAMVTEASLFLDWYVPEKSGSPADASTRSGFEGLWREVLDGIRDAQTGWVLRDFHSPNLLWQEGAEGTDRIGLIDFQDAVLGPVAYDVASLLLDARTDIGTALETELFEAYVSARRAGSPGFDERAFADAYGVMAVQRISKILGIFVRLARRDGKPAYLSHLPRMLGYLERALDRPLLSDLKDWYARHLS
ncbi:MAG: bifunctional tRNA (adenosine(37)-N6)-threonylcarbamoyltransferase complex ATPase subunit type 1 TsaE/phosphotransferase [Roseibium sp.]